MPFIRIRGLHRLDGEIEIQGSKNASLPVMAAALLHKGTTVMKGVPDIQDVRCMMEILEVLGCSCELKHGELVICGEHAAAAPISQEMAGRMRSSIMLLGPMLGRFGEAATYHPGGCSIGNRPVDLHLRGLEQLGASLSVEENRIVASVGASGLKGSRILLTYPSVGATENILLAAAAAEGVTILEGAAREPEIDVLCHFLTAMGVKILGIGGSRLVIEGQSLLRDTVYQIPGDRIVAGTYLGAVMAAGGRVRLRHAPVEHMRENLRLAEELGAELQILGDAVVVQMNRRPKPVIYKTGPYPEAPTDLQSVMMSVAAVADGSSRIQETVFENRFSAAKELQKLGAHIIIEQSVACVEGTFPLRGGRVSAQDLRGGAALAVAGLAAEGVTDVTGYAHISRGYEDICRDLRGAGADIVLIQEAEDGRKSTG